VSYAACEFPYFAAGVFDDESRIVRLTPERLAESRDIDVRILHEVLEVDPKARRLVVRDLAAGTVRKEGFDKLVLATGARAGDAGLDGAAGPDAFVLRTPDDAVRLKDALGRIAPAHAVIVGAGFIGLELATLLRERGWRVTVLDANGPLGRHLDPPMVGRLDDALARFGVAVRRERAASLRRPGMGPAVVLKTDRGELVGARIVILAAGIVPLTGLGGDAIRRTDGGTYLVDATMRTSARGVWACGDCVSVPTLPDGSHRWIPLSPVAFRGARVAGHNAARQGRTAELTLPRPAGSYTARIADVEVASVGLSARDARTRGLDADYTEIRSFTASSLHPHSRPVHVGLVFERPHGRLLGAQVIAGYGAALRADVVAAVLQQGGSVTDLYEVDYAYAPPVAPAFDPLMVAARTAQKALGRR
jgi:NADPH-dependent 2,4-dienoyl-CoA reductase/sulfur reductase-like enzyme